MLLSKRSKEYNKAIEFIESNRKNFIILSSEYYKNKGFFPYLVSLSALLRGRSPIYHTALIINKGNKIFSLEISPAGIKLIDFKTAYFSSKFKGTLKAQVIRGKKTLDQEKKIIDFIKSNILNKKYGKLKAGRSWTAWKIWEQKDDDKKYIYCTDAVLDIIKKFEGHKIFDNHAEVTPAQLYEFLLDDYRFASKYCVMIQQLNNCSL